MALGQFIVDLGEHRKEEEKGVYLIFYTILTVAVIRRSRPGLELIPISKQVEINAESIGCYRFEGNISTRPEKKAYEHQVT